MRYDTEGITEEFHLVPFGSQGWLSNREMPCPFCGKSGKWGIIYNSTGGGTFHCWKCPRKTSLWEFLKKVGRLDLAKGSFAPKMNELDSCPKIGEAVANESAWMAETEQVEERELKPVTLPLRLKPLVDDPYLNERGFRPEHYREYEPSYTDTPLEAKLKNFIVFKMKIDGVCVAWWARSRYSKEWHKRNLEAYKRHEEELVLRYRNSENNFQNLLGGCDKIVRGKTNTVILVEGIFDSIRIDNLLHLYEIDDIKCCFTFGNNIGQGQIDELVRRGVRNVILMYDYGTINESKDAALKMRDRFDSVLVAAIRRPGIDPGNITLDYLNEVLEGLVDPVSYFCDKLEMKYDK